MGHGCSDSDPEDDSCAAPPTPELEKLARDELREDPATREHGLRQLREWLRTHPAIRRCRTDAPFLLRFLRTKKFSVPLAQSMIERYLLVRQLYSNWFQKLDIDDPDLMDIIDKGYLFPLIERDDFGRMVIVSSTGRFDPYKYTCSHMARCHAIVLEALMDDPENQIRGYTYVNDESGLMMGHLSLWSLTDIRRMIQSLQHSAPVRHKAIHFLNVPTYANKIFEFFSGLLNEKFKSRMRIHTSVEDLKECVNLKILPKEYGGEVPMADMIEDFKKLLKKKRDQLIALDDMEIDLNYKAPHLTDFEDDLAGVAGSFRKLEVD